MTLKPLPVFRSVINADALIRHVLSQYPLGTDITCTLFQRGINDVYLVTASSNKWILRVGTTGGQVVEAIEAEIEFLQILASSGIAVPAPVPRRDGAFLSVLEAPEGRRCAVLFAFVEGESHHQLTPEQARLYGQTLAHLHAAADRHAPPLARPPHNRAYFIDEPLARLAAFPPFAGCAGQLDFLNAAAGALWEEAERLPHTAPHYGLCHGDFMSGNALFNDAGVTVLDFDYCGCGWRVYDLATFIWSQVYDGFTIDFDRSKLAMFRALVAGYESARPLTGAERQALPGFAALRQMFLFGAVIKNAPGFGVGWMDGWLDRSIEFIRACRSGDWLARVGLA
ncbi:MAG: phosphotransferase [Anaerolineae bacterium]|nr:phosphotransferase [Anaerolineae bacterium]